MPTSGPFIASSCVSDSSNSGDNAWIDTADAIDGDVATIASSQMGSFAIGGEISERLKFTNFSGFSALPAGATISEIQVTVKIDGSDYFFGENNEFSIDNEAVLVKAGTIQGDNQKKSDTTYWRGSTDRVYTFSGLSWSKSDITDTGSGFIIAVENKTGESNFGDVNLGEAEMLATYSEAAPSTSSTLTLLGVG